MIKTLRRKKDHKYTPLILGYTWKSCRISSMKNTGVTSVCRSKEGGVNLVRRTGLQAMSVQTVLVYISTDNIFQLILDDNHEVLGWDDYTHATQI